MKIFLTRPHFHYAFRYTSINNVYQFYSPLNLQDFLKLKGWKLEYCSFSDVLSNMLYRRERFQFTSNNEIETENVNVIQLSFSLLNYQDTLLFPWNIISKPSIGGYRRYSRRLSISCSNYDNRRIAYVSTNQVITICKL